MANPSTMANLHATLPTGKPIQPKRWTGTKIFSNLILLVMGAFFLLPMLWLFAASVDNSAGWQLKIPDLTDRNYIQALQPDYANALLNSLILSLIATIVATSTAFLSAYAFSRQHIPWKGPILLSILFLSGIPISILIVPIYKMFNYFNWLSMFPTAILLGVTALPFEIYLIKNSIDAIPLDLEEAASIEKAGTWKILYRIVIPLTMPGIASAAIFGFVNAWGNFLIPLVLISKAAQQPGPVRMFGFMNSVAINYGAIAAFSILYSLPVVVLYLLMARSFRSGFVLGGAVR